MSSSAPAGGHRRAYWLKTLHQWHWISAALCLIGMLVFSVTGITLNHAAQIGATPAVSTRKAQVPEDVLQRLQTQASSIEGNAPLPHDLRDWLATSVDLRIGSREAEWSADEIYAALPRPGGDAWIAIDLASGMVEAEVTDRGWVSYFNDLHKGRHTGAAWSWFIDVFAIACLIFCLTGLFLLQMHARQRALTWPMVGAGLVIPALLALLLIH
ncbi:MAG: PepSY-associated TM helix domain-containing protein [Pseudomarimonas sp.]